MDLCLLICVFKSSTTFFLMYSCRIWHMSVWHSSVFWVNCSMIRVKYHSLALLIYFYLVPILANIGIMTPVCFLLPFSCNVFLFLFIFYSKAMSIFKAKLCFLQATDIWILFLHQFWQPLCFEWRVDIINI